MKRVMRIIHPSIRGENVVCSIQKHICNKSIRILFIVAGGNYSVTDMGKQY